MSFFDSNGLFWEDQERVSARGGPRVDVREMLRTRLQGMSFTQLYTPPPLRTPPPGIVALDLECEDPDLNERGPSWAFAGRGQVLGVALAWEGFEGYYSFAHSAGNVDAVPVWDFIEDLYKRPDIEIVCAKAVYDIGWLRRQLGKYPLGTIRDVLFMAALLDENRMAYSLDSIAYSYLGKGKETDELHQLEKQFGVKHADMMGCLKYLPAGIVGPYAVADARLTYELYHKMLPMLEEQGLMRVHELESKLIPMSTDMRRRGIRINLDRATALRDSIVNVRIPALQDELKRLTGVAVEPWVATSCEAALNTIGVVCARTANGSPEVDAELLTRVAKLNPVGAHILNLRKHSKILRTFLEGHILGHHENGRIHAEFNQLKSEREEDSKGVGTVSGRYASSKPNLQQIPDKDPDWGPQMRGLFEAEEGQELASLDYGAQEPRLTVHFAALARVKNAYGDFVPIPGAAEAVRIYNEDPKTDYHQLVADLCWPNTQGNERKAARKRAKSLNLGLAYGMGGAKLARALELPTQWMIVPPVRGEKWREVEAWQVDDYRQDGATVVEVAGPEAKTIIKAWDEGAPFIRGLYKLTNEVANTRGYITTILGRRCRFLEDYESGGYSHTHKAMNRLNQGSAADQTKLGLLALWEAGITPLLTIHDENVFSVDSREQAESYVPYMSEAVKLLVPSVVEVKIGKTWGDIPK